MSCANTVRSYTAAVLATLLQSSNTIATLAFHQALPIFLKYQRFEKDRRMFSSFDDGKYSYQDMQLCSSFESPPSIYSLTRTIGDNDGYLAYRYFKSSKNYDSHGSKEPVPVVIFINGLLSNMSGTKSKSLQCHANEKGSSFLCFDYRGHGSSSGKFADCTMHDWMEDARNMLDHALLLSNNCIVGLGSSSSVQESNQEEQKHHPKVTLVGSSMGVWIALHIAMERPQFINGVVGIGAAIDFTHHTYQKLSSKQQQTLLSDHTSAVDISSSYLDQPFPFSYVLYDSGNEYLLCSGTLATKETSSNNCLLKLCCPVRFLHGSEDEVVPWSMVTNTVECLQMKYQGKDVAAKLLDGGDHRLSRPEDISVLLKTLDDFL